MFLDSHCLFLISNHCKYCLNMYKCKYNFSHSHHRYKKREREEHELREREIYIKNERNEGKLKGKLRERGERETE